MKYITILLLLFSFQAHAGEDLGTYDKKLHIAASYGVALTSTMFFKKTGSSAFESILFGSVLTLTLGLGKELCDEHFSKADMAANLIGTGFGAGMSLYF